MRVLLSSLLALIAGIGCARIYRPVELVQPRPWAQTGRLSARIDLQPWGDNSRYEARALHANLRVLVLSLENQSASDLEAPSLELPEGASTLSVEEALGLVKQQPALYLLSPLVPGLMIPGAESKGSFGPSARRSTPRWRWWGWRSGCPTPSWLPAATHAWRASSGALSGLRRPSGPVRFSGGWSSSGVPIPTRPSPSRSVPATPPGSSGWP